MPFACIFVPDFPVEALLRAEPELRSQAVAVLEGKAPLQKVFAVNEKARRAGVEPGMTKLQVEACAGLVPRARSPLQENAAHAALLDCAQSFSPRVEDAGCDTIVLDLAGLELLFGPLPKIARAAAHCASDLGLGANVAVASNPDTAVLAARGFSGITIIPEGEEAETLGSLPLETLLWRSSGFDCGKEAEQFLETFSRWGVRNLRALAALPDVALSERLGQKGVYLQQLARGSIFRTLVPVEPPLVFEEMIELEYPLVLLEPLAFLLGRLLDQLCARLSARALVTQELRLRLELENGWQSEGAEVKTYALHIQPEGRFFKRTLHLPVPLLDARLFLKLLQLDLKAHPPGAPIVKIHLSAEPARPRAAQSGLFLPPSPEPEKLELTLARITDIVGEDKAGSLALLDTHRSEGFCMQRFAPEESHGRKSQFLQNAPNRKPKGCRNAAAEAGDVGALTTPLKPCPDTNQRAGDRNDSTVTALRIFRPPVRATVTLRDGQPARIACPKREPIHGEVLWVAGPWRSSGDWWEQEGWARDEWDLALQEESGIALYRLVHDLLGGRWYVEGTYD